jgi:hypothetical protein
MVEDLHTSKKNVDGRPESAFQHYKTKRSIQLQAPHGACHDYCFRPTYIDVPQKHTKHWEEDVLK